MKRLGWAALGALAWAIACGDAETSFPGGNPGGAAGSGGAGFTSGGTAGSDAGSDSGGSASSTCTVAPNCSGCKGCLLTCVCEGGDVDTCTSQCAASGGNGGSSNGGTSAGGSGQSGSNQGGSSQGGSSQGGSSQGGSSQGGSGMGTCNPAFCPNSGFGTPCCVTLNGPCGSDFGMGCMQSVPDN